MDQGTTGSHMHLCVNNRPHMVINALVLKAGGSFSTFGS